MLNKGILERVNGELRVRVLENSGEKGTAGASVSEDLPTTLFVYRKGVGGEYQEGDAVIVGYEKDDISRPVVIGRFLEDNAGGGVKIESGTLTIDQKATLPQNTTIGSVKAREIGMLQGLKGNIQAQINNVTRLIGQRNETEPMQKYKMYITDAITAQGEKSVQTGGIPQGYVLAGFMVYVADRDNILQLESVRRYDDGEYRFNADAAMVGKNIKITEIYLREDIAQVDIVNVTQ